MREMKDSGVEWIGNIPKDWSVTKFKYIAEIYTGNSISDNDKDNYTDKDNAIPYIATKDITQGFNTIDYNNGLYIKEEDKSFVRAMPGSTLMCIEGGSAGRKKAFVEREICFVNKLCCFSPKGLNGRFLYYLLNSPNYEAEFSLYVSGLIGGVSKSQLKEFSLPKPDDNTQMLISNYLDSKCSLIDSIIAKQEAIIDKLNEYKLSVITEVITKGLNPDVDMKDSDIEWIGKIPETWEAKKLASLCDRPITYGIVKMGDYDDNGVKALRCSDVLAGYIEEKNIRTVTKELSNEYKRTILKGGEIVINVRGTLGGCSVVPNYMAGYNIAREIAMVAVANAIPKFVMYNLLSNTFKSYQEFSLRGVIYVGLNINLLNKYVLFLPNLDEQEVIVKYLDNKCQEIEKSIEKRNRLIKNLQEYKKALIYEVVTGKKEV
jgi:type I restriction enzyme S subunit